MANYSVWIHEHSTDSQEALSPPGFARESSYTLVTVNKPQLPQCLQCLVDCKGLSQSHCSFRSNPITVKSVGIGILNITTYDLGIMNRAIASLLERHVTDQNHIRAQHSTDQSINQ